MICLGRHKVYKILFYPLINYFTNLPINIISQEEKISRRNSKTYGTQRVNDKKRVNEGS